MEAQEVRLSRRSVRGFQTGLGIFTADFTQAIRLCLHCTFKEHMGTARQQLCLKYQGIAKRRHVQIVTLRSSVRGLKHSRYHSYCFDNVLSSSTPGPPSDASSKAVTLNHWRTFHLRLHPLLRS